MSSWKVDPRSGDYLMENGAPVPTERLNEPVFYRTKIHRSQWLYAPNTKYGSDFYTVSQRGGRSDPRSLIDIGNRALSPLVEDGRALSVTVSPNSETQVNRSAAALTVEVVDIQGQVQNLDLPPIRGV